MDKVKCIKKINLYLGIVSLILIDQITKLLIIKGIKYKSVTIIKGILSFSYCENKGIAFSFGSGNVPVFIIINLLIIAGLVFYFEKNENEFKGKLSKIFFTMVIAGGVGNLIDRIFKGYVIDFIDFNQLFNFAIFNVADIFIVAGIIGIAINFLISGVQVTEKSKK